MKRTWISAIIFTSAIVIGVAAYMTRPLLARSGNSRVADSNNPALSQGQPSGGAAAALAACVRPPKSRVVRGALNEKYRWARTLVDQKLFDAALPELRDIAAVDPGFPGINLDISDALVQLKQPAQAKQAIDVQTGISDCLAKLPTEALDVYCKTEFALSANESCEPQLDRLRQAAQLQATLVKQELGGSAKEPPVDVAEKAEPRVIPVAAPRIARPPATQKRVSGPIAAPVRVNAPDKTLMDGEGTDSALGAYSKPE